MPASLAVLLQIVVPPMPPGAGPHIPWEVVRMAQSLFTMIAVIALGTPIIRAFTRRFERGPALPTAAPPDLAARLERIEQAVDAIAIEVERISEAQRFATRLMAEGMTAEGRALPGGGAALRAPGGADAR